jgi:hypothetical protein
VGSFLKTNGDPGNRHRATFACLALMLAATGLSACGGDSTVACRYDPRPPLPDDIHQPQAKILARAERILRRAARTDRESGLVEVLGGSGYAIDEIGTWQVSDAPGRRRQFRIIGAVASMRILRPHAVDAVVLAAGRAWPRGSSNYRYSRRYGYVEHRNRLVASSLTGVDVSVDVRRGRVVEVGPSPAGAATVTEWSPLPGQCPISEPPPD